MIIFIVENLALALIIIGLVRLRTSYVKSFEYEVLKFCKEPRTLKKITIELNKGHLLLACVTLLDVYILMQNLEGEGYINFVTYYDLKSPNFLVLARQVIYPSSYITKKDKPPKKRKYKKPREVSRLSGVFAPSV